MATSKTERKSKSAIKRITTLAVILLIFTVMIHSCEETEPTLPPETQTGAHTFGCYVNEELFVPQWGTAGLGASVLEAWLTTWSIFPDTVLTISASNKNGDFILDVLYPVENQKKMFQRVCYRSKKYDVFYEAVETGEILLTRLDTVNMIVSGTFAFTIPSVHVTQGRFDIKELRIFRY